jgi:hypothetical protein
MTDFTLLVAALAVGILFQLAAAYTSGSLQAWARDVIAWGGLLWTALAVLFLGSVFFNPDGAEASNVFGGLVASAWISLCIGGSFSTGSFLIEKLAAKRKWRVWVTQGFILVSAVPSVLAGFTLYALLLWAAKDQEPFWASRGIAQMFDSITLWLISTVAVFVGFVRLLYNVRLEGIEADRARLEAETTAARLSHLEARLRPHFLYNALSGLAGLIRDEPVRAEAMTLALARLLQRSLDGADAAPTHALRDELDLVRDYLAVEQERFGDRLNVSFRIEPDTLAAEVPRLTLQPLVENAIKHGLGKTDQPVHIHVGATHDTGRLHLTVADDGPPFPADLTGGHGLTSVTERLTLLYGDRFEIRFDNGDGAGQMKHVHVTLPFDLPR